MQVYADSQLLASIVQSSGCSRERRMYVLRTIMNAMGNSAQHTSLYFKFQSVVSMDMDLLLEACGHCDGDARTDSDAGVPVYAVGVSVPASVRGGCVVHDTRHARCGACQVLRTFMPPMPGHLHCDMVSERSTPEMERFLESFGANASSEQRCGAYFHYLMSRAFDAVTAHASRVYELLNQADVA